MYYANQSIVTKTNKHVGITTFSLAVYICKCDCCFKKLSNIGWHKVSEPEDLPEHGVTVVFVELPNTKGWAE